MYSVAIQPNPVPSAPIHVSDVSDVSDVAYASCASGKRPALFASTQTVTARAHVAIRDLASWQPGAPGRPRERA